MLKSPIPLHKTADSSALTGSVLQLRSYNLQRALGQNKHAAYKSTEAPTPIDTGLLTGLLGGGLGARVQVIDDYAAFKAKTLTRSKYLKGVGKAGIVPALVSGLGGYGLHSLLNSIRK